MIHFPCTLADGSRKPPMRITETWIRNFVVVVLVFSGLQATVEAAARQSRFPAREAPTTSPATSLQQLSSSLIAISRQVEPAVVQIFNSSYGIEKGDDRVRGAVVAQQRSSGSGVLITSDGFIVTNAHVVERTHRLWVRLNKQVPDVRAHLVDAKLIGLDRQTDLAVIKVDLTGLPFLSFGDSSRLEQGQIVLAFGSPLGLENSVSMGVVSAVDRQLDADDPRVFIQTDAAINPGNSGGPLVNTGGELVGLNTFIFTQSGGNEGVGFAIPGNVVNAICRQIRIDHHVHHHQVGISVRAITPALSEALGLPIQDGVVIEDVSPESPAAMAGLIAGDIIVSLRGKSIQNVRELALNLYSYAVGDLAEFEVIRKGEKVRFRVAVFERPTGPERFEDLITGDDAPLPRIDVLGVTVDDRIAALMPPLRISGGVLVAAKMVDIRPRMGDQLLAGDIIHALNGTEIKDLIALRNLLESLKPDSPLVVQIERAGVLRLIVVESE